MYGDKNKQNKKNIPDSQVRGERSHRNHPVSEKDKWTEK